MFRVALATTLWLGVAAAAQAYPMQIVDPPSVQTQGEAVTKRVPDRAWIQITAEARGVKPAEAQQKSADAMTAVQATIKRFGLPADAIKTTSYSLQPDMVYNNGQSSVKGFIVRNQIEIRVDDMAKFGEMLDAVGASGATSVSSLRYDLKDRASVERDTLALAVKDGLDRARAIVLAAGKMPGDILRIQDQNMRGGPIDQFQLGRSAGNMAMAATTPIAPGEIEVHAQVTVTIAIR